MDIKQTFANSGRSLLRYPPGKDRPCSKCGQPHQRPKNGGRYLASTCYDCKNAADRAAYRRKRGTNERHERNAGSGSQGED